MMPIHKYVGETPEAFEFKGMFQNTEVGIYLLKENGQVLVNADEVSRILGNDDFGDLLSQDEALQNAFLDDMNEDFVEFSNAQLLSIMLEVNKIEDAEIRQSLTKKLGL